MLKKWLKSIGIEFDDPKEKEKLSTEIDFRVSTLEMNFLEVMLSNKDKINVKEYYRWHLLNFIDLKAIEEYHEKFKDIPHIRTGFNYKKMAQESKTIYRVEFQDSTFDILASNTECLLIQPIESESNGKIEDSLNDKGNHTGKIISTSKSCDVVFNLIESIWHSKHFDFFEMNESYQIIEKDNKRILTDSSMNIVYAWSDNK